MKIRNLQASNKAATAEQRMRTWALGLEVQDRVEREKAVAKLPDKIHPYLAISREAGAGGSDIAYRVGELLQWEVLDKELLDYMAERYQVPHELLKSVDESTWNWFHEVFGKWLERNVVTQSEYVAHLGPVVLMAAQHGSCVFVGRGVQFILPRARGLTVRIVAPQEYRIRRIIEQQKMNHAEAAKYIASTDKGRYDFVHTYYRQDISDSHQYDLVVNMEHFSASDAAELIADQCRRRFGP